MGLDEPRGPALGLDEPRGTLSAPAPGRALFKVRCRWMGCGTDECEALVLQDVEVDPDRPIEESREVVLLCPSHARRFIEELEKL